MHLAAQAKEFPASSFLTDFPITNSLVTNSPPSRLKDTDFLMAICHEIRTPLSAIIGLANILASPDCNPKRRGECAAMLNDSSNMLVGLLNDLLDSSKIHAGKMEVEHIRFDILKVIRSALNIISTKASAKGLNLQMSIGNNVPAECMGDPLRLSQILLNLLSNAVKFTEKGYVMLYVNVVTGLDGADQLSITIVDTGIGIRQDQLERNFGQYAQSHSGISRHYGGTGLGLSISRDLAHLMRGDITVKSWPGIGSHFIVTLPLSKVAVLLEVA